MSCSIRKAQRRHARLRFMERHGLYFDSATRSIFIRTIHEGLARFVRETRPGVRFGMFPTLTRLSSLLLILRPGK